PSSICCPLLFAPHFCAEAIFACAKTSGTALRRKRPRWFTHAPRLVDTVTSGDVVTIRSARSPPAFERSSRMRPNAAWVDCSSPEGAAALLASDAAAFDQGLDTRAGILADAFEGLPLAAFANVHGLAQRGHLS